MSSSSRRPLDQGNSQQRQSTDDNGSTGSKSTASTATSFDVLAPTLLAINEQFTVMNEQFRQLKKVDKALSRFNDAFGAFLFGLAATGSTVQYPNAPTSIDQEKYRTKFASSQDVKYVPQGNQSTSATDQAHGKETTAKPSGDVTKDKNKKITKKGLKFVSKINIKNIIARLPLKYREQTEHMKTMETVLRVLRLKPEGMNMATMVNQIGLPQYRVTDCLNALVRSKDVQKFNPKGQMAIYRMDPTKYASH